MQVTLNKQQTSFKQIKLSEQEIQVASKIFNDIKKSNGTQEYAILRTKAFDLFKNHLNKEAELKGEGIAWKAGKFAKDIYIRFYNNLKALKFNVIEEKEFVNDLNIFSESEFTPASYGNEDSLSKINIFNFNENVLKTTRELYIPISKYLGYLIEHPEKKFLFIDEVKKNIEKTAEILGFTPEEYRNIISKSKAYNLFFLDPKDAEIRCSKNAKELGIDKETFVELASKFGRLLCQKPERVEENKKAVMETFKLKSQEDFVTFLLKNPQVILMNPAFIKNNMSDFAKALNVDDERIRQAMVENPALSTLQTNVIKETIDTVTTEFGIDKQEYIDLALKNPRALTIRPEILIQGLKDSAKALDMTQDEYISLIKRNPRLLTIPSSKIQHLGQNGAEILQISKDLFTKMILLNSNILISTPEIICENYKQNKELLNVTTEEFLYLADKNPSIFTEKNDKVKLNIDTLASKLNLEKEEVIELCKENPQIITWPLNQITRNIDNYIEYFNTDFEKYVKMVKRNPRLITITIESLDKYVQESATLLNIANKNAWKNTILKNSKLATLSPKIIRERAEENARVLDLNLEEYLKIAITEPQIFTLQGHILYDDITNLPKILKIKDKELFKKAFVANPTILTIKPNLLQYNFEKSAKSLDLKMEEFTNIALKNPQLFTLNNSLIYQNITEIAEILKLSVPDTVKLAKINPTIFSLKSRLVKETCNGIMEKFKINHKQCQNLMTKNPHIISTPFKKFCEFLEINSKHFNVTPEKLFEKGLEQPDLFTLYYERTSLVTRLNIHKFLSS